VDTSGQVLSGYEAVFYHVTEQLEHWMDPNDNWLSNLDHLETGLDTLSAN
jgi:hypothetical protein